MVVAITNMDELPHMCVECSKLGTVNHEGQHYCVETRHVLDSVYGKPKECPLREVGYHDTCGENRYRS